MRERKPFYLFIPWVILLLNIYGCAPLLLGVAIGGVGIYAVGKDTVQGETDKSFDALWKAALTVSRIRGEIKQENYSQGYIGLQSEASHIWIRLMRLTRTTNRLKVSARKYHLPNQSLAQELFVKILEEAR